MQTGLLALINPPAGQTWRLYYYAGGQRVAMRQRVGSSSVVNYLVSDHLGSTSLALDSNRAVVAESRYYPYGDAVTLSGTQPTDFQFTGQLRDAGIGLDSFGARWYDPYLNRFISADSIVPSAGNPQALNRYSYTNGNPLKYTDPTGHCIDGISTAFCVAFGVVALTVMLSSIQGDSRDYHAPVGNAVAFVGGFLGGLAAAFAPAAPAAAEGCAANDQCQQAVSEAQQAGPKVAANSGEALLGNLERGRELAQSGQINQYVDFFKNGMSDSAVGSDVPASGIQDILGKANNIYVVGKPALGKDLDLFVVGEQAAQFSDEQIQAVNKLAEQAGFTDAHVHVGDYLEAAAWRFATQPTSDLSAFINIRDTMLWRLIDGQ